jgi:hypothetical protein
MLHLPHVSGATAWFPGLQQRLLKGMHRTFKMLRLPLLLLLSLLLSLWPAKSQRHVARNQHQNPIL